MRTRGWRRLPEGGEIRAWPGPSAGPNETFEYRENGRMLSIHWAPREQGNDVWDPFDEWTTPPGEPLDGAARTRVLDGLWVLCEQAGIDAIYRWSSKLKTSVVVRWNRGPDGYLIALQDTGSLVYMELGRTLVLRCRRSDGDDVAVVEWPDEQRWTEPDGPVTVTDANRVRLHLAEATAKDYRYGAELGWRLVVRTRP